MKNQDATPRPEVHTTAPAKRPYVAPRLTLHGKVADLTQQAKTGSLPDVESAGSHTPQLF